MLLAVGCALVACSTSAGVSVRGSQTLDTGTVPVAPITSVPSTSSNGADQPGDGVGDELFPGLGNPGVDVTNYDVQLAFDPATDVLQATVVIDLTLTTDRQGITLDAAGPQIDSVAVDDRTATFRQDDPELRVSLPGPGHVGDHLRVAIAYHLSPKSQESIVGLSNGWFNTAGGAYVLNEPDAAHTWLPCNDHPSDKATFTVAVTVPAGLTAIANGELTDHHAAGENEVWVWREQRPMTTYLMQLFVGDYQLVTGVGPHGLPLVSAVLRSDQVTMQSSIDQIPAQIAFFERFFGPYPLDRYGIAITDSSAGLAMETQERSYFSRDDFLQGPDQSLLAHELVHQWFGDAVSPQRWSDVWLNESFATYGEWMWMEHLGEPTVDEMANRALHGRFPGSTAHPSAQELFGYNSYEGGAVVVHALRKELGDELFFTLLQRWVAGYNGTSRTTEDFTALAETVAGRSLSDFFAAWLYAAQTPSAFPQ